MNYSNPGWNFDNTYSLLPKILFSNTAPIPVKQPNLIIFNDNLSNDLGLNFRKYSKQQLSDLFSGNYLPTGSKTIAQAYAGHQFGYFSILGDGRATMLGEHISPNNKRFDIQYKGSGRTPYSRNGDGRATLISMLREYIFSEAMHSLDIPTTRSLAVVSTGEIVNREEPNMGGILTRVASSHIRVGTFEYLKANKDILAIKELINYCLKRHYPNCSIDINPAVTLLKCVMEAQISLIINWMRVGYIMGVANSDNVTISGETIDYGPCAFMNSYNPLTVYSSIDHQGRYSFGNQPLILHWNLSRFAETLIPLLDKDEEKSLKIGRKIINSFSEKYKKRYVSMMKKKFGFFNSNINDEIFIKKFLNWMGDNNADYTNTFANLLDSNFYKSDIYKNESFVGLKKEWESRILKNNIPLNLSKKLMISNNPFVIPRSNKVEEALTNISKNNNYDKFYQLLGVLKNPYIRNNDNNEYRLPPKIIFENNYKTYCGT